MRAEKSNFTVYSSLSRADIISKPANIVDLIKKNKEESKREKIRNLYSIFGFAGLILLLGTYIYL